MKKKQKQIVDEMMKVYETNPDVINYMEALMKFCIDLLQKVEQLEKENKELNLELSGYRQAILNDDNLMGLKLKIDKAITYIKTGKTFENKNTKKVVDTIQNDLLNILNKGSDKQ